MKGQRVSSANRAGLRRLAFVLTAAAQLAVFPPAVDAQQAMSGVVVDSETNPLAGVELTIEQTDLVALTNSQGAFRFRQTPPLPFVLRVRRIGFSSVSMELTNGQRLTSLTLVLRPIAQTLPPVSIVADRIQHTGRLTEYYTRLDRRASGVFITRSDIDQSNARNLSFLLERVPGLQLTRGRVGATLLRFRGRTCRPLVWIDGVPMPSADVDINSFAPNTLHGIELYFGFSTVPARYVGLRDGAACGTILLWTRGSDTEYRPEPLADPAELERLVERLGAFTAEHVDTAARLDGNQALRVSYPPALFAERLRGRVVAEFVVNPQGRVEPNTIGIVSATHPLFALAVRATLQAAAYRPAVKEGREVFQLVHQAFEFDPVRQERNE